jgi:hypothetical protein
MLMSTTRRCHAWALQRARDARREQRRGHAAGWLATAAYHRRLALRARRILLIVAGDTRCA